MIPLALVTLVVALGFTDARRECKVTYNGVDYQGTVSVTRTGRECQTWSSQEPHRHIYTDSLKFPDLTLADAANYCRTPEGPFDFLLGPWCYTTDAEVRWQYCDVPSCPDQPECRLTEAGTEYRGHQGVTASGKPCRDWGDTRDKNYCRNPDGRLEGPYCYIEGAANDTSETCEIPFCKPPMHCKRTAVGREYSGRISRTRSGGVCQRWDSQHPHHHTDTDPDSFPDPTLEDAADYCRNPDGSPEGPWCYTLDPKTRREYGIVDLCQDCLVSKTGREYSGSRSETRSGRHCQRWDEQSPHAHSMTDPSRFPDMNLTSAGNYCRNPDDDKAGPWCFTADPDVRREDCGLNLCEAQGSDHVRPPLARHVVHIGIDGLRPDIIGKAPGGSPNILKRLRDQGTSTLTRARTVLQTTSSPAWSSALCGMDLTTSGVTSNAWRPPWKGHPQKITPVTGNDVPLPCTFQEIKTQDPNIRTGIFHDWVWLFHMASAAYPGRVDKEHFCPLTIIFCDEASTYAARNYLKEVFESADKSYTFIYFGNVDEIGHTFGWGSSMYNWAVQQVDRQVGILLDTIADSNMTDGTMVVLHADHGGEGTNHGNQQDSDLLIPMFLRGPGIKAGHEFEVDVSIVDIAPTVMYALGLKPSPHWNGQVMWDAFENEP